jgi:hypothetical protein
MLHAFDLVGIHPYAILHENPQSGATGRDAAWYMLRPFRRVGYEGPHDIGGVISQYPRLIYLVTETGTFTHSDTGRTDETWRELSAFFRACQENGRVVGVTPFIWNSDAAHPQNVIWPNERLRGLFETMPRYVTTAVLPVRGQPPAPPPKPQPEERMEYTVGPGVRDAMRARNDKPASHEQFHGNLNAGGYSLTVGESALYIYTPATGVVVYPKEQAADHR